MGKTFLTRRTGLLLLVAVIAVGAVAVFAGPASAHNGWQHGTATLCSNCHPGGDTSVPLTSAACTACHTGGFTPLTVAATQADGTCWGCHAPGKDMSAVKATSAGCSSAAAGCHTTGAAAPHVGATNTTCLSCHGTTLGTTDPGTSPHHVAASAASTKPVFTAKLSASSVKVKKTIKASGLAFPAAIAKVTVLVQKKSGTKWVKVTTKTATANPSSAWSVSYKATKKGSFRMQASTAAVTGVSAGKSAFLNFKVK
jgi:hypothetical protein